MRRNDRNVTYSTYMWTSHSEMLIEHNVNELYRVTNSTTDKNLLKYCVQALQNMNVAIVQEL